MSKFISKKEKKLLYSMLFLFLLVVSYQFIYVKNVAKQDTLEEEITALQSRVNELSLQVEKKDVMLQEIEDMKEEIVVIADTFGNGHTMEKDILFIKELENIDNMKITTLDVSEDNYFLTPSTDVDNTYSSGSSEVNKGYVVEDSSDVLEYSTLTGYRTDASINFTATYGNLKKCIKYITEYKDKRNINEISLAYDSETGNLKGYMNIGMYHILGTEDEYEMPNITTNKIGTDNIFGTIELP